MPKGLAVKPLVAALLLALVAVPVRADDCQALAAQVRAALAEADLDAGGRAAVRGMVREAMRHHRRGDHAEAEETLRAAMTMLGLL